LLAASGTAAAQTNPPFHPAIVLRAANGENVLTAGAPVSTMATCGACHDVNFIASHSSHADGALHASAQPLAPFMPIGE
jgi:cytochrome c553